MVSLHNVCSGTFKLSHGSGTTASGLYCILATDVAGLFGIRFLVLITLMVGFDRMISLIAPISYHKFGKHYIRYVIGICAMVVLGLECLHFALAPLDKQIVCLGDVGSPLYPAMFKFFDMSDLVLNLLNLLVYAIVMVCFWHKKRTIKEGSFDYKSFMKQQETVMPTITLLIILYSFLGVLPDVLFQIAGLFPRGQTVNRTVMTTGVYLKMLKCLVEVISLASRSSQFRDSARALFCKSSAVMSFTTH